MKKNCYTTSKLVFLFFFILFTSCNSKIEKESHHASIILKDSANSEEFLYNELEQKWKRNSFENTELDSLVRKIVTLNNQGDDYRDKSLFKDALIIHFKALQLAEEINDTIGIISALNNIGTDLRRTSSNVEATEYHYRALELAGYIRKNLKSKAIAMNGLGNVFLELQKPNIAEEYFEKSLAIEIELESNLGQAINYANFGNVMEMKGDLVAALSYYNKSLQQNYSIHSNLGIAICKNAIGSIYINQNKTSEGLKLIREAVNILQNSQDAFHKLEMEVSLCKSLINLNHLNESKTLLNQIFQTSNSINSYSSRQIAYELQTLLSKKQQDFKTALAAKEMAISYRDSTSALNNEVKILEIENRYKTKEALQQIKFLIKEKALIENTNKNQQRIFILLVLLMSSISVFTYYMYRNRKHVNQELRKVSKMKSRFFGNISHEFRTPLTLIKGPLEKMLNSKLSKSQKEDAEMMYRNTDRLLYLVNQILNLSKIDAGKFRINAQQGNLANEIKGISQSFEYISNTKKINYSIAISDTKNVWYDSEIVEMLLTNILSNAFKFTPEKGNIIIKGTKEDKNYIINVSNTVENITNKDINLFFDRFYSHADSSQHGTGIGLSLVKELCSLYRATISVNKNGNQLEFAIILPTSIEHFDPLEINKEPNFSFKEDKTLELNSTFINEEDLNCEKHPIMLIVEDNDGMRSYIASIFNGLYCIIEAKDGKEGLELSLKHIPDIIISDVMMPCINGIELCNMLKTNSNTNHIPIILLTALTEEKTMLKGLNEKADDYITKPFVINVLTTKVNNLVLIRKTLANKYREEIVLKPMNQLLKWGNNSFSDTLKKVLENEITNPNFGVEEFCSIASMSRTQLHRKLKAITGMYATEFIRVHRVKNASELLRNKNLAISEICFASGFKSTSYFSKQFKIVFGCSPKEYRENF
jgi:signal transduction histidine kinase/AraC-like DNA-binding protein